jgi:hypothetical protein
VDRTTSDGMAMLSAVEELFKLEDEPEGDQEGVA